MKGTCLARIGPHRRAGADGLSACTCEALAEASEPSAFSCSAAAAAGGSTKNMQGKQLTGSRTQPAMITAFIT